MKPLGAKLTRVAPALEVNTAVGEPTASASLILLIPTEIAVVLVELPMVSLREPA